MSDILKTALQFANEGICVLPVRTDGSKAPALSSWKKYQFQYPTRDELMNWFGNGTSQGLGILTGGGRNLEMMEFEGRAMNSGLFVHAKELAENSGLAEVWDVITNGYMEMTPSGGCHFLFFIVDHETPGNQKFAQRPGEGVDSGCLIESRGSGGFTIVSPSGKNVHPSGKSWEMVNGNPTTIPTLTWDERNALADIFRMLDEMPTTSDMKKMAQTAKLPTPIDPNNISAGDDFNLRATWDEILIPRNWSKVFTSNGVTYWRRPGKSVGISASTGRNDADNLYVFSTSTDFPALTPLSKWAAITWLDFSNDFTLSARHLVSIGYGKQSPLPPTPTLQLVNENFTAPGTSDANSPESLSGLDLDAIAAASALKVEIQIGRARRGAKKHLDLEDLSATYTQPLFVRNWKDEMALPEVETVWAIKDMMPQGSNVTLTAQFKAGKTTMVNALVKSLCDDENFLNYFETQPHPGRVVVFNYEVSENQYRRWLKDVNIKNPEKLTMLHLRGQRLPLTVKFVEDQVVQILQDAECETWIVDPFARAFVGGDENSNSEVGVFLDTLDVIKERAGVKNLILPIHTGRQIEGGGPLRARGATRTDDWADVRWMLKKTEQGRFLSADGRDVLVDEQKLTFNEETRSLTFGGLDSKVTKTTTLVSMWVDAVAKNPNSSTGELCLLLGVMINERGFTQARKAAENQGLVVRSVRGGSHLWNLNEPTATITPINASAR